MSEGAATKTSIGRKMRLRGWGNVVRRVMSSREIKRRELDRAARMATDGLPADASAYRRVRLRLSFAPRPLQVNSELMPRSMNVVNPESGM